MNLQTPLMGLAGIGPSVNQRLRLLELHTVEDLITYYPFRYDDFSHTANIAEAQVGEVVTIKGQIWSIKNIYTRTGKRLTQALLNDGTNTIEIVWFNQSWLTKSIQQGDQLQVSGKISKSGNKLSLVSPKWEKIEQSTQVTEKSTAGAIHTGRLVPIYSETYGLTSKWLRAKIAVILPQVKTVIEDPLPKAVIGKMLPLVESIQEVHFPTDFKKLNLARERLAFDELFYIQLATQKTRHEWNEERLVAPMKLDQKAINKFIKGLPFQLTKAQLRVITEILADLKGSHPMNRLIQGEVGSGKTVVAAAVAYAVILAKFRVLIMAPTEILALQHYQTLQKLLSPLDIEVGIYTGSQKFTKDKNAQPMVIVGTHALVAKNFSTDNVGLVIIDEQQRFGVEQRTILRNHAQIPHFMTMTATPIPRTVALTMYGDLDISIIDEVPPNRIQVKTHYVPNAKREAAYKFITGKVTAGDQVYIVTPLIEPSETLSSAKAAIEEYERLQKKIFPQFKLGLLHGRLKPAEKAAAINDFKDKKYDILVSTSVVEVGVDVANATIIVIEGAERFGLAGLHQLRGRVGRGTKESFCFLFTENDNREAVRRLKNLETINNGLKLAELDLKIRGSGEVFGTRQSGRFNLKIASLSDLKLIEQTKSAAQKLLAEDPRLDKYPAIQVKLSSLTAQASPD